MARIDMVGDDHNDPQTEVLFSATTELLGRVPHSYRIMAQSPFVAMMLLPFNAVLQREGGGSLLTTKIKEMVVIKTSHLNGCAY